MKRRVTELAGVALLLASLAACANTPAQADTKPVALTTFTVLADMASVVAGPHIRVESITKVGVEIHGYEPTPSDIMKASRADLIVANGLGLEAWFEKFIAHVDAERIVASEGVEVIPISDGEYRGQANPHAWMSAPNGEIYVDNIAAAFSALDPAHADDFAANAEAYKAELRRIHEELLVRLDGVPPGQRVLVTCEGAFSYLARDTSLTEAYIWAVNAEQQATPQQIARTIATVRDNQVPGVFCESTVSSDPMEQVAREAGSTLAGILYVDSLSTADGPVPTYLDLLEYDSEVIASGLSGQTP